MKKSTKVPSGDKLRYSLSRKSKKRKEKISSNLRSNLVSNNFYISNINIGNLKHRINSGLHNAHSQHHNNPAFMELRKKMLAHRSARTGHKNVSQDFGRTGFDAKSKLKIEGRSHTSNKRRLNSSSSKHKKSSSFNRKNIPGIENHPQF